MQVITNLRDIVNHAVVTNVEFQNKVAEIDDEIDALALHRLTQYNENHIEKLTEYNDNDTLKMDQYNANHIERLENINYAYADRIVEMIKTRNFMGIMDEYVAKTATHMITFLDTTDTNYIYYANGTLLVENVDYTVYNSTTIELTVKANPYDVIVQVNTQVLRDMLTAEGVLFANMLGQPNGVAGLDDTGKVPSEQLPSYVDDVLEVATYADLPVEGETGKIYVVVADETSDGDTSSYRWTGTVYAMVSNTLNAADVKALYEASADTNAYTDAEKKSVDVATVLDTTAITLPQAVNEVHGELNAHVTGDGSDHSFIDQDVTVNAEPTFASLQLSGGTGEQGKLTWNADEKTLDLIQNGNILQLGQDVQMHIRNNSGAEISNGTVVMMTGTLGASGKITVAPNTISTTSELKYLVGIAIEDIANDSDGKVTTFGKVQKLDTTGGLSEGGLETWVEGNILYIDTVNAGKLTNVAPTTGIRVPVAVVVSVHGVNGTLLVRVNNMSELLDSNDILVTPQGNLSSETVQLALEEIMDKLYNTKEW